MIELNEKISKTKIQIGEKYGRLLIISRLNDIKDNSGHRHAYFKCKCDCGNEKNLIGDYIGKSVFSCGCLQSEKASEIKRKHNIHNTFIYNSYKSMISRCYSPNFKGYSDYGGRGITVCREWYNPLYTDGYDPICVLNFYNWAINNPTYKDGYTLDRIDPNGNYCPENCRWADSNIQANNKRTSKYIIYNGEKQTVTNLDNL